VNYQKWVLAIIIVLTFGGYGRAESDPSDFCARWEAWDNSKRESFIMQRSDNYARTGGAAYTKELGRCVGQETLGLIRKDARYYLCDFRNNFSAGVILGQAQTTAVIICLRRINPDDKRR